VFEPDSQAYKRVRPVQGKGLVAVSYFQRWAFYCDFPGCTQTTTFAQSNDHSNKNVIGILLGIRGWNRAGSRCPAHKGRRAPKRVVPS
jgi:hypothetical protein